MMWILRDLSICCLQIYMLVDFEKNFLTYRIPSQKSCMIIYAFAIVGIRMINHAGSTVLNMIGIPVCYMVITLFVFRDSIWKKSTLSLCYYMLAIAPEFMFAAATNAYGVHGHTDTFQSELEKTWMILLMKLVTFIMVKLIGHIRRKRNYQAMENKIFVSLLMLPIATIVILASIYYAHVPLVGINRIVLPFSTCLLLFANIVTFYLFEKFIENKDKARKMERLYQKSGIEIANLKYLTKKDDEHKAFLHDISRFVRTAGELIHRGETQEAVAVLSRIGSRIQNIREFQYSADALLNSILSERRFIAESRGIGYHVDVEIGLNLKFMDELDVISVVGNLLDNAIEAAEKVGEDPYIECKMYTAAGGKFLMMEFRNNYKIPPRIGKKGYISSKREPGNHGIGLHTVEKLVKQYGGKMRIENSGENFKVTIAFGKER